MTATTALAVAALLVAGVALWRTLPRRARREFQVRSVIKADPASSANRRATALAEAQESLSDRMAQLRAEWERAR